MRQHNVYSGFAMLCSHRSFIRPFTTIRRNANSTAPTEEVMRLTKRMSQLDLCSRREADRFIMNEKVLVKGVPAFVGMKVAANETDIVIMGNSSNNKKCSAVVLNKPIGYVSGQPEHGNKPSVKLLTRENAVGNVDELFQDNNTTLTGFAPAGRLDRDSSGLLIYTKSGVVAKKLVSSFGLIPKEYLVTVEPAHQPTTKERAQGLTKLPRPTIDLKLLKKGGGRLLGDPRPLRPIRAKWLEEGQVLRLLLREGRKRQIRRIVRELLGFHAVTLERTKIGPVVLNNEELPVGKWRPLTQQEVDKIISKNQWRFLGVKRIATLQAARRDAFPVAVRASLANGRHFT